MIKEIINLLFPPKCIFCGSLISITERIEICAACYGEIPFLNDRIIRPSSGQHFDGVICLCEYKGIVRQAIVGYKFFNKAAYYRAFALMLADKIKKMTRMLSFDIIISVPLHYEKQKARGYNQSYLISRVLGKETGIFEGSHLLSRVKNTESQSTLSRKERILNVENAFKVSSPEKIAGKRVLLIDDVLTTGSTLDECSKVLKLAGALEVVAVVVASGRKY